jgi:hypothetical protein
MDPTGKIVWAKHNEIQAANVKVAGGTAYTTRTQYEQC